MAPMTTASMESKAVGAQARGGEGVGAGRGVEETAKGVTDVEAVGEDNVADGMGGIGVTATAAGWTESA